MNPAHCSSPGAKDRRQARPVRPRLGLFLALVLGGSLQFVAPGPVIAGTLSLTPFPHDDPRAAAASRLKLAMEQLDSGDPEAALSSLALDGVDAVFAPDLVAWTRGLAFSLLERAEEADEAWGLIPLQSRLGQDALLRRAENALDDGRPDDALAVLGDRALDGRRGQRLDLLRARAFESRAREGDADQAYASCKRVWLRAGRVTETSTEATDCMTRLRPTVSPALLPGVEDKATRSTALGSAHRNDAVIELLENHRAEFEAGLKAAALAPASAPCIGLFQLGRAFHKKRQYTRSVPLMKQVATRCTGDLAVKAQYLLAEGLSRSGQLDQAVASYAALADRFPNHSYADDGLYHGGRLLLSAKREDEARELFVRMADEFPEGDMLGKGLWGLAWAALAEGQPEEALPWLERVARGDVRGANRERVLQARYWQAATLARKAETRGAGIEALAALVENAPAHYYGVLALWRLSSLDTEQASRLSRSLTETQTRLRSATPESRGDDSTRAIGPAPSEAFMAQAGAKQAIEFVRGGFPREAGLEVLRALGPKPSSTWDEDTLVFAARLLEAAADPHHSHNLLRRRFRNSFPELDKGAGPVLRAGYPLAYHDEIRGAMEGFRWDPLLFQGLVREESAFAAQVVSWAGAMGLSQLMWPTAKETARKMGNRNLQRSDLDDPSTNVSIGATYFNGLHRRWKGHLPLAIASYNAGPGAVGRWVEARGHLELDAFVETIPYDQTRHYVKRVLTSFQVYNLLYGDGLVFVPLRIGEVNAAIQGTDPGPSGS